MNGPHYLLNLRDSHRNRFEVQLQFTPTNKFQKLQLPAWTPGSYLERAYSRHLEGLKAFQGNEQLRLKRLTSDSWMLEVTPNQPLIVNYALLAVDASVRTNLLDHQHGFLTAAAWALEVDGQRWFNHLISVELPKGWSLATALLKTENGTYWAENFDQLVDSPLALGDLNEFIFAVGGVPHRWVWQGLINQIDQEEWNYQLPLICKKVCDLMAVDKPPVANYLFLTRFYDYGYGGLEHSDSCALIFPRKELNSPSGKRRFLQLVAHEYLHLWNIKQLRPLELYPYSYTGEIIIPSLWFAEGVTSYYDSLIVLRAGLCNRIEYYEDLAKEITRYLLTPGRYVQSLQQSSEEAWVKLYRRDQYSDNQQMSYYLKGQLVALLIDLHLISIGYSLQNYLQDLWHKFGRSQRGYTQRDLLDTAAKYDQILAINMKSWLEDTGDLNFENYFSIFGILLTPEFNNIPFTGLHLENQHGELTIIRIDRDSPAEKAMMQTNSEILAIDSERCKTIDQFNNTLSANNSHSILINYRGLIQERILIPEKSKPICWCLHEDNSAASAAVESRERWLNG
jgi:predicted metalloprotease with PDZ domain